MFKQYLQYILTRGKVRLIVALRSVILILMVLSIPSAQSGGIGLIELLVLALALVGTYFANGFVIRSEMDPKQPVVLRKYLIFFLWMIVAAIGILLLINFIVSPFIGPEMQTAFDKYAADPTKPMPQELARLYLIVPFVMGLIYFLILPVLFAKVDVLQGLRSLPTYLGKSDYILAAWTPYVIMFVPTLIMSIISGSQEMVASFLGQLLVLVILFFSLTSDILLQYPTFYIVQNEIKPPDSPPESN